MYGLVAPVVRTDQSVFANGIFQKYTTCSIGAFNVSREEISEFLLFDIITNTSYLYHASLESVKICRTIPCSSLCTKHVKFFTFNLRKKVRSYLKAQERFINASQSLTDMRYNEYLLLSSCRRDLTYSFFIRPYLRFCMCDRKTSKNTLMGIRV